jgi:hypothetical protein
LKEIERRERDNVDKHTQRGEGLRSRCRIGLLGLLSSKGERKESVK